MHISAERPGVIKFQKGANGLTANSPVYNGPVLINDNVVLKAGLFIGDSLVGKTWSQNFNKIDKKY